MAYIGKAHGCCKVGQPPELAKVWNLGKSAQACPYFILLFAAQ